ncbi:MAG: hydroxymethylglutaryl-CoA lyase [Pseudomonadota bacterium]
MTATPHSVRRVTIFEVGPRDGLQNEPTHIPTADKIALVDLLSATGLRKIEVTSFVHPKWVPQMADAADVLAGITRADNVDYAALTPNLRGYEGARASRACEVAVFAAASETFAQKNTNCSIDESFERFAPIIAAASRDGIPVRGYVSCVVGCPYEGAITPRAVRDVAERLIAIGCYEVSLGDTIGCGSPETIDAMLDAVLDAIPAQQVAGHYHDTNGRAVENIAASLARGVRTFDTAVGGLGGCPYAPGAAGNVATETVLSHLHANGYDTSVDEEAISAAARFARDLRVCAARGSQPGPHL